MKAFFTKLIQKLKGDHSPPPNLEQSPESNLRVDKKVATNEKYLNQIMTQNDGDLTYKYFSILDKENNQMDIFVVFMDSLVDSNIINEDILKPLMQQEKQQQLPRKPSNKLIDYLNNQVLNVSEVKETACIDQVVNEVLKGFTAVFLEGADCALLVDTKGWQEQGVTEAEVERSVRGPQASFTENIKVNMGLIRRKIKSPDLKVKQLNKGRHSHTSINILWMQGICNEKLVGEVIRRIQSIDVDQLLCCTQLSEYIDDNPLSPFNTQYVSERPDVVTAGLTEGRVAIMIDGSNTCLIVPMLFIENLLSPDDYYTRYWFTFVIRSIRFSAALMSLVLPAFYISVIAFHQEIIPDVLAARVYGSREGVPFPAFLEILLVGVFFEALKEAGSVIPQAFGSVVGIVGALILGQQVVEAGLISSIGVIVGALTGISIFLLPTLELNRSLVPLRILLVLFSATLGLYGLIAGLLLIVTHLTSLRSFGVPYMSPITPFYLSDMKDVLIRVPYTLMKTRPKSIEPKNQQRLKTNYKRFFFKYK